MTATKTKRMKNLFPKITRGGYTVRIHFMDESRGERYFDSEWGVHGESEAGRFNLTCPVDYRGFNCHDNPSINSIGKSIRVGDSVAVHPSKWNMRGKRSIPGRTVVITSVVLNRETGFTELGYSYP